MSSLARPLHFSKGKWWEAVWGKQNSGPRPGRMALTRNECGPERPLGGLQSSSELLDAGSKSLGLGYGRAFEGRTNHLALIANKVISCFKFPFYRMGQLLLVIHH